MQILHALQKHSPRFLLIPVLLSLVFVGCQTTADPARLWASDCDDGSTNHICVYKDTSRAAQQARAEDLLWRFARAQASAQPEEIRIEIVPGPNGQGSIIRCYGPKEACTRFIENYERQRQTP
jgi:hypothetical protein